MILIIIQSYIIVTLPPIWHDIGHILWLKRLLLYSQMYVTKTLLVPIRCWTQNTEQSCEKTMTSNDIYKLKSCPEAQVSLKVCTVSLKVCINLIVCLHWLKMPTDFIWNQSQPSPTTSNLSSKAYSFQPNKHWNMLNIYKHFHVHHFNFMVL